MKGICRELRQRLAGEGASALRTDAAAQRHLEECTECFQTLEALARLDDVVAAMPALDVSDDVVGALLARVDAERKGTVGAPEAESGRGSSPEPAGRPRSLPRPLLWGLATAASLILVLSQLGPFFLRARMSAPQAASSPVDLAAHEQRNPPATLAPGTVPPAQGIEMSPEEAGKLRALAYLNEPSYAPDASSEPPLSRLQPAKVAQKETPQEQKAAKLDEGHGFRSGTTSGVVGGVVGGLPDAAPPPPSPVRVGGAIREPKRLKHVDPVYPELARNARVQGKVILNILIGASGEVEGINVLRGHPLLDGAAAKAVSQWIYAPTLLNGQPVPVILTVTLDFRLPETTPAKREKAPEKPESAERPSREPVPELLEERSQTEGLTFQPARGYWANTYLPGDTTLRVLRARLLGWDRAPLEWLVGFPVRLHDDAAPPSQPFDAPRDAGLAVYLHADRRGLDKPSRTLVQVGLQGSPRSGGPRPPTSIGLVLDLRGDVPVETAADMRALALAFAEAREAGDRFSLIAAGRSSGVLVGPERFRHGPLAVALDHVLTNAAPESSPASSLPEALATAFREVSRRDDPETELGLSAVVFVTGQPLGEAADAVVDLAHQGAVAGIPLSVVAVGSGAPRAELDRVALIGQGSRRVLSARAEAARLVEAELASASDVVARAVRLRIRLTPGVRFVGIVGSRRLDAAQARRVREVEHGIDLRLANGLGIESDRGLDEDGIQIVIPAFHAGDAHVILLDVVAEGPGPVADVSVRYKDLVGLRNGRVQASLRLPREAGAPGPLERNVVKNLLALRLADTLAAAASSLDAGDLATALSLVDRARQQHEALLASGPGWAGDPDLTRDVGMLQQYANVLERGARVGSQLVAIADSLRYAGRLKRLPRPAPSPTGTL
jgi:TonB family protein